MDNVSSRVRLMGNLQAAITEAMTVDTLTEKVKMLQDENAALREKLAKCEEDE